MEIKKLGEEEVIKKNYEYLLLAQQNGLFQDCYDKEDISTCSDWVITWWIDELGKAKEDKDKFVNEMLPNFKRWFSNGINSTGVGMFYNILKMAERKGIKINDGAFSCISSLMLKENATLNEEYNSYESISEHFKIKEIMDNLTRFNKSGIPLCYSLADCYDCLIRLEKQGEKIDFDTFIFFHTAGYKTDGQKLNLYDDKKYIEDQYGYSTCNASEVTRLMDWLGYGGYNSGHIQELKDRIRKYEEVIQKNRKIDKSVDRISRKLNQKVSVSYYELDEQGNRKSNRISGTLVSCDENGITLSYQNPETQEIENITIKDNDTSLISKVSYNGVSLYESRTLKEREMIQKLKVKVAEIKSEDIASKYVEKYGTIEGLAYLKKCAPQFISTVNQEQFPIDNLFTACFENIASIAPTKNPEEILQYVLYAYNKIMAGEFAALKNSNFGYPPNKFLSDDSLKVVEQICHYVVTSGLKAELPEMPTSPMKPTTAEPQEEQKQVANNTELLYSNDNEQELDAPRAGKAR